MRREDVARDNKAQWDVLHPFDSWKSAAGWAGVAVVVGIAALYLLS